MLVKHLSETWDLNITESHPKALHHLLTHSGQPEMVDMIRYLTANLASDHERDATLSAVAAWAMVLSLPGWRDLYEDEPCPVQPFDTPISYWMPIP